MTTAAEAPRSTRLRSHRILATITIFLLFATATSCSSPSSSARSTTSPATSTSTTLSVEHPKEFAAGDASFQTIPDPIPTGRHGDLLRYQRITDPPDGLEWFRIMYLSETTTGKPTVETGVLTIPATDAPASGFKLATHAHGSTGFADDCAPSSTLETNRAAAAELMVVGAAAAKSGYVVVSADYEGQGGPGRHPFLVGQSEGRSVLDAARAARQFPGLTLPDTLAILGYSQGGHAALWANQIAKTWTPEFDILGTLAGAPASEVSALLDIGGQSILDSGQAVSVLGGLEAANPELHGELNEILTPGGQELLAVTSESCTLPKGFEPERPFLTGDPRTIQPWKRLMAENTPGGARTQDPILIIHSQADESVPISHSKKLLQRMCEYGQVVERRVLPEGDHVIAAVPAYTQGFEWLVGLEAGKQPVSSCPG